MKKFMVPILIFPLAILFSSCKKDEVTQPALSIKTGFITNGTWNLTAAVSDEDGNGSYETNDFLTFLPCYKDNIYTFKTNGQLELNEGPTKCDPGDSQIEMGTWSFATNENDIKINTDIYPIVELTNTSLKFRSDGPANTSSIVTFTKR